MVLKNRSNEIHSNEIRIRQELPVIKREKKMMVKIGVFFMLQGVLALCEFHYCEFRYCGFSKPLLKIFLMRFLCTINFVNAVIFLMRFLANATFFQVPKVA